jgi:FAD/FMN-containing dehydrogenase
MDLIRPDDPRYDEARTVFNAMIDKRPAVIASCANPADVIEALELAEREQYDVAVRAGGHSVAGVSLNDGGIVIDVRPMKTVEVDPAGRTVRVGAGVNWGEFDRATQEHGLATTGGRVSTTGVAGLTLGGGSGWLERLYGLSCDNLLSVDLVTADGREVTASEDEHPDLFWALHGGGCNFGVATSFTFRLYPVGPEVTAGLLIWPGDSAGDVARLYRDTAFAAPDELGSGLVVLTAPPEEFVPPHLVGTTVVAVAVMWAGDAREGEDVVRPFRDLAPEIDLVGPMPYADFQCMIDDPPGYRNYWTSEHLVDLPDAAIEAIASRSDAMPAGLSQLFMVSWGGAVARVGQDASPLSARDARFVVHPFGMWEDPAGDAANIEWARGFRDDLAAFSTGAVYLNFVGDEGEARVRAGYGPGSYERLAWVKAVWDPDNVFRASGNVPPPTAVTKAA